MAISQVVAMKVDGTTYSTIPPNVTGSGSGGNGGAVAKASNTNLLDGITVSRYNAGVFGSTVIDNYNADKAFSAGTFAYNNPKPIAKRVTTEINGSPNNVLLSGASAPSLFVSIVVSIHKIQVWDGAGYIEGTRTTKLTSAIREGKWNQYTGEFDMGYPQSSVDEFGQPQDQAANVGWNSPGKLTYKYGSPLPTSDFYKIKTG